jgi:peptidoglycan/xylan/chitin deacetylase (PgdA/CDA1 family)
MDEIKKILFSAPIFKLISSTGIPRLQRNIAKTKTSYIALFHGIFKTNYPNIKEETQRGLTVYQFERIVQWLMKEFNFITPTELTSGIPGGVLLTFDDGFENFKLNALPILEKYDCPALIFLSTQHIHDPDNWLHFSKKRAKLTWGHGEINSEDRIVQTELFRGLNISDVKFLASHPLITIGGHTVSHPILSEISILNATYEIAKNKQELEMITNKVVEHFAYPGGKYNENILSVVRKYYKFAYTIDSLNLRVPELEITRVDVHSDLSSYLDLKFSPLHKSMVVFT